MPVKIDSQAPGHGSYYPESGEWKFKKTSSGDFRIGPVSGRKALIDDHEFQNVDSIEDKLILHLKKVKSYNSGKTKEIDKYLKIGNTATFEGFTNQSIDEGSTIYFDLYAPSHSVPSDEDDSPKGIARSGFDIPSLKDRFDISKERARKLIKYRGDKEESYQTAYEKLTGEDSEGSDNESSDSGDKRNEESGSIPPGGVEKFLNLANNRKLLIAGSIIIGYVVINR